jgi:hypothetical protein
MQSKTSEERVVVKRRHNKNSSKVLGPDKKHKVLLIGIAVIILVTTVFIFIHRSNRESASTVPCPRGRALVADGLSTDFPNPKLDNFIINTLRKAGYEVDYFNGTNVDLQLFSKLSNYDIIILRVHGGKAVYENGGRKDVIVGLFTGVPWSDEYKGLMRKWLVTRATPYALPEKEYLAVLPKFFEERLEKDFCKGSVMVVGSCYTLLAPDLVLALGKRGLTRFIGWTGAASVEEVDKMLYMIVDLVFNKGYTWSQAVNEVRRTLELPNEFNSTVQEIVIKRK